MTYKLQATVPQALNLGVSVIVLADTVQIYRVSRYRPQVLLAVCGGDAPYPKMQDGLTLKQLYGNGNWGQQMNLAGIEYPLPTSWLWLKRAEVKRESRSFFSLL